MMKTFTTLLSVLSFIPTALATETPIDAIDYKQQSKVLDQAYGDLDRDGVDEKVIVLDTGLPEDFGTTRTVLIYKNSDDGWKLMHFSEGAILASHHGGAMGDPFMGISIERGALVVRHMGGSMHKWDYVHRFRMEDNQWSLIGATIQYGILQCDYFEFDYNLLTGKAIYKEVSKGCWEEDHKPEITTTNLQIQNPLKHPMDNFYPGSNIIDLPKIDETIYY